MPAIYRVDNYCQRMASNEIGNVTTKIMSSLLRVRPGMRLTQPTQLLDTAEFSDTHTVAHKKKLQNISIYRLTHFLISLSQPHNLPQPHFS